MDPQIRNHFRKIDPTLCRLLTRVGEMPVRSPRHPRAYFRSLCSEIISQQLSGKVADIFWDRFLKLFPSHRPTPRRLLILPDSVLRGIGISNSKVSFLKSLADYYTGRKIDFSRLSLLPDEEVIDRLTQIKGIGRWTAEMFLMFTLARPDVFSSGDQGLKNAIKKHYPTPPDPVIWSPYRS